MTFDYFERVDLIVFVLELAPSAEFLIYGNTSIVYYYRNCTFALTGLTELFRGLLNEVCDFYYIWAYLVD